ncbi:hypothetical protein RN001_004856 [Aquatica leii]|uniref:Uncharacterized protein n=1 Tax=Aquatica leii TaxID=1421715 RepID=A0AAN7SHN1_9COLE|nr:hypothetical protein RN001_004856 [Aquatica leii]
MSSTKERLRFAMFDDLCLLREVLAINPYEDSIRWKDVLAAVIKVTSKKFTLRAIKEHLQYILMLWAKEDRDNLRNVGLQYLRKKQLYDRTLKEKEIQMENRKISCEERKIE